MGMKLLLYDEEQLIFEEYIATSDFICGGQIIRAGSIYRVAREYPPSHHIEEIENG